MSFPLVGNLSERRIADPECFRDNDRNHSKDVVFTYGLISNPILASKYVIIFKLKES